MKRSVLSGFLLTTMMVTSIAHADFKFYSNSSDICNNISGEWNGKGSASNWLIGTCIYHGKGTIGTPDSTGRFTLNLDIEKDSGNFLCAKHTIREFSGTCVNGDVTIITEFGNLQGTFSENSGSASGTLTAVLGMTIDVSTQFQR